MVRTRDELAAVIEANPFPDVDNPKKNLHVTFFSGEPDAEARKTLESTDFGDDRLAFKGREVYIAYKDGMGRSELAKQLTRAKLGVAATDRNWNTVTTLLEMADGVARVQHPRGDHAADRAEQVALPRDAGRRDEPEHQRRAVDREHEQPDDEVHRAVAPHARARPGRWRSRTRARSRRCGWCAPGASSHVPKPATSATMTVTAAVRARPPSAIVKPSTRNGSVLPIRCPQPACRNGASAIPGRPSTSRGWMPSESRWRRRCRRPRAPT